MFRSVQNDFYSLLELKGRIAAGAFTISPARAPRAFRLTGICM